MNAGQMVADVRLAVAGQVPVAFYGRMGGVIPAPDEVLEELERHLATGVPEKAETADKSMEVSQS